MKPSMKLKSMESLPNESKKKKKKEKSVTINDYAAEINAENREREKEDDLTSESSDESTTSDEEDEINLKKHSRKNIIIKETDFEMNEPLSFTNDVYNYTICANMTRCCSPLQQGFALKQCFIVFSVQLLVPIFFLTDNQDTLVQPKFDSTAIRLICAILLHIMIYTEVKQSLSVLRYLKYVKSAKGGKRGRMINIMLSLMQLLSPLITEIVLILAICKTP